MTSQNVNNLHTAQKLAHVHQPGWFMTREMRSDICECHCVEFIYQTKIKEFLEFHQIFLRCIQMGNVFGFFHVLFILTLKSLGTLEQLLFWWKTQEL